jgi:hypothetical protein
VGDASECGNVRGRHFTIASSKGAENTETQSLGVIDIGEASESQNSIDGSVFAKGKLAVDMETIGFLARELNLPSNFIWEEFCK